MKIELSSKELNDFVLKDKLATVDQLSAYLQNFICRSENDGIALGDTAVAIGNNSIANGMYTVAGCNAFAIASKDDNNNKYFLNTIDGIQIGDIYSAFYGTESIGSYVYGNRDYVGKVLAIDPNEKSISVDVIWKGEIQQLSDAYIWFPGNASANGDYVVGTGSTAIGYRTYACQVAAHAEGYDTIAGGKYAHAEGLNTIASYASHAEGNKTSAFGQGCHAEGYHTIAGTHYNGNNSNNLANYSHAEGYCTKALGYAAHAAGISASTSANYSWVWNGDWENEYSVDGIRKYGSFNVNPKNGISSFYIGNKSLYEYLSDAVSTVKVPNVSELCSKTNDILIPDVASIANLYLSEEQEASRVNGWYLHSRDKVSSDSGGGGYVLAGPITLIPGLSINAHYATQYAVAGYMIVDANGNCLSIGDYNSLIGDGTIVQYNKTFTYDNIKTAFPHADAILFSSLKMINGIQALSVSYRHLETTPIKSFVSYALTSYAISSLLSAKACASFDQRNNDPYWLNNEQQIDIEFEDNDVNNRGPYINRKTGLLNYYGTAKATKPIDIIANYASVLKVYGTTNWDVALGAIYNKDMAFLSSFGYKLNDAGTSGIAADFTTGLLVDIAKIVKELPTAQYLRFSSLNGAKLSCMKVDFKSISEVGDAAISIGNVLAYKKYVAAGDSFTLQLPSISSYANIIAKRNRMDLINIAVDGSKMGDNPSDTNKSFVQTILNNALSNVESADYMTICYGLNETSRTVTNSDISSDSDVSTVYGSWNTALSTIFNVNPAIKVGIIIADAWMSSSMHDALSAIGQWWGIPVLDLKNGATAMIDGRTNGIPVNPFVIERRNTVFKSQTNHPTQLVQEFRSTIIENWMRSL